MMNLHLDMMGIHLLFLKNHPNKSFRQMIPKNIRSVDSGDEVESEEEDRGKILRSSVAGAGAGIQKSLVGVCKVVVWNVHEKTRMV
jgi:hypothetical protein